jgi:hypothetical protein
MIVETVDARLFEPSLLGQDWRVLWLVQRLGLPPDRNNRFAVSDIAREHLSKITRRGRSE